MKKMRFAALILAALLLAVIPAGLAKAATKGAESFIGAPEVMVGKEYTIGFESEYPDVDLQVGLDSKGKLFYKVEIPTDGTYVVRFKSAGAKEMFFEFYDSNFTSKYSANYKTWDSPAEGRELDLVAGTHYFSVYTFEKYDQDRLLGSFSIVKKKGTVDDVTYDLSETIHTTDEFGIVGSTNYIKAPRLAFGEEYTVSFNDESGSNINLTEKNTMYMFKLLVPKKATYAIRFKQASEEGFYTFLDSNYNKLFEAVYLNQGTKAKVLTLEPGTYYVRVNTYKEGFQGAFSVTDTTVKLKSLKAGSKQLAATWTKFLGVSGYEIRYSTKKNMSGAVSVEVSGSKKSTTIKKLKSGKTYYVQIRPYILNEYNEKQCGAWSNKLSKKVK